MTVRALSSRAAASATRIPAREDCNLPTNHSNQTNPCRIRFVPIRVIRWQNSGRTPSCFPPSTLRRPARTLAFPRMKSAALLTLLRRNARTSIDDLARELGVGEETVAAEIARLESEGVILGYHALVDAGKIHAGMVTAVIEVKITPERGGGFDRLGAPLPPFDQGPGRYPLSGACALRGGVVGPTPQD